jgi:hypothetical protein
MKMNIIRTMAALLMATATFTACTSSNDIAGGEQSAGKYTMTITASKGNGATTRALSLDGSTLNAMWKKGEAVKVIGFNDTMDDFDERGTIYAQSDGASTTLTGTLDKPIIGEFFFLAFPKFPFVYTGQKGTLADIAANFDYVIGSVEDFTVNDNIITTPDPVDFYNEQAIVKFTLKDQSGNPLNATSLTIHDEGDRLIIIEDVMGPVYDDITITPDGSASEIWAALSADRTMNLSLTATVGSDTYTFSKSDVKFKDGQYYDITVKMKKVPMVDLASVTENTTIADGFVVKGTLASNVQISIADGATVTLQDVTINGTNNDSYTWAGITCLGSATIILKDGTTNTVSGFHQSRPGIYVPAGSTLTIRGEGSLTASSNGFGAGIGAGRNISCGNIVIESGTVSATGGEYYAAGIGSAQGSSCGTINITGGTVSATGGQAAAGIGSGSGSSSCGDITIDRLVTSVTATKGQDATNSIGAGYNGTCGNVTVGGIVGAITNSPFTFPLAPTITWTSVENDTPVTPNEYNCYVVYGPDNGSSYDPAEITISGTSMGYYFWMNFGATIHINGLTATYGGNDIEFIYCGGDLNLDISGANTIACKNWGKAILVTGTLMLSGSGTLTVTVNDSYSSGLKGTSNYNDETSSAASALAAPGHTVTRSDRTDNGDGTYTWTYTVAPTQ